jgi:hypothetical protein
MSSQKCVVFSPSLAFLGTFGHEKGERMRKVRWVFWILPDNSPDSPKSSENLRVCGDHRPFLRRY